MHKDNTARPGLGADGIDHLLEAAFSLATAALMDSMGGEPLAQGVRHFVLSIAKHRTAQHTCWLAACRADGRLFGILPLTDEGRPFLGSDPAAWPERRHWDVLHSIAVCLLPVALS